jgi:hypothetical protein
VSSDFQGKYEQIRIRLSETFRSVAENGIAGAGPARCRLVASTILAVKRARLTSTPPELEFRPPSSETVNGLKKWHAVRQALAKADRDGLKMRFFATDALAFFQLCL